MQDEMQHEAIRIQAAHETDVARVMVSEKLAAAGTGAAKGRNETPSAAADGCGRLEVSGGLPR